MEDKFQQSKNNQQSKTINIDDFNKNKNRFKDSKIRKCKIDDKEIIINNKPEISWNGLIKELNICKYNMNSNQCMKKIVNHCFSSNKKLYMIIKLSNAEELHIYIN